MDLLENVPLAPFTTLGVGGPARWFVTASGEEEVAEAISLARQRSLPVFVLGGGSNLLVSDRGFDGLVIQVALRGIEQLETRGGQVTVRVAAGESWDGLVQFAVDHKLAGIECLAGIPGTVGGTPVQNVGAYGQQVSETIHTVRCFDIEGAMPFELSNADCGFGYRTSLLNTSQRGRFLITRVDFALTANGTLRLEYADLRKRFSGDAKPSLCDVAAAVRDIRRAKGMVVDPSDPNSRSAGSFFRNPVVDAAMLAGVAAAAGVSAGEVPSWSSGTARVKLPAAWLLEHAGFTRGYSLGRAGISARHTLALINLGGATAHDILELRDRIVGTVQQKFGIVLEQEPVFLANLS